MLKKFLERIGFLVGRPRTLTYKENIQLRKDGVMESYEVAWEAPDKRHWFIRNNRTSELRVVSK